MSESKLKVQVLEGADNKLDFSKLKGISKNTPMMITGI